MKRRIQKINIIEFKNKKILLLCHENTDLDSFCSAAIFKEYLKRNKIESVIGVPSHINEQTTSFARKQKMSFIINPNLENFDLILLFDFNDFEQLGFLRNNFKKLLLVKKIKVISFDHHFKEKRSIANGFINPKKLSTTELLFDLIGKSFNKKMFFYACLGMIEDTGRFLVGSKDFFESFSICLKNSGKKYSEIFRITKHVPLEGEKIAFLKAIQRAKIIKIKNVVLITSKISFYQGVIATKLLEFGADISIVCGLEKKGITNLSARAETFFKEKNNFNLMKDLMIVLEKDFGGEIGGHSGAAQWKGIANEKEILKKAESVIKKFVIKKVINNN
ncbi:MAG: DHH family phosphoesterase [Candidatus ainarchaeum sp.]|nr:DHH family phosphoesterase [Candidatus ainarchaeum sp.]